MKVNVTVESIDINGEVMRSSTRALLEERACDYKVSYVERLSDSDKKTKTVMYITSGSLRIVRDGEIKSDFMYGEGLTHNSIYKTPYGDFPVSVITEKFSFFGNRMSLSQELFESFPGVSPSGNQINMNIEVLYQLILEGAEPMNMKVKLQVESI